MAPLVPRGTEPDSWQGKTFVSLVGFLFLETRVLGIPIPFHRHFEEVNLRFYVRRRGPEGWRRGVVFIREIVPRLAIATVARVVYNENYEAMPMRHAIDFADAGKTRLQPGGAVEYGWKHQGRWNSLRVRTMGDPAPLLAGSEEEFITEHYWGYARQRDGGTVEYRVEHPSWRVWRVSEQSLDCDVTAIYGEQYAGALRRAPSSAFLAEGSEIVVRRGIKLENGK
ncbi:MAG: YqjF family protein [Blastocatellia bacterium]